MRNNKPFWELGLNPHTMLPAQKVINASQAGIKKPDKSERRKYYKG